MDFAELEAVEGLRWPWHAWPASRSDAAALVVPTSVMATPLAVTSDLPLLQYDPLLCTTCRAAINPYARIDYRSATWNCPFCAGRNPFPRSYHGIGENNLPPELFPTCCSVEYILPSNLNPSTMGVGFVFVVDACIEEEELRFLKNEMLHVIAQLPEKSMVGLVSFGSMVWLHDLKCTDCSRVLVLHGERELSSDKVTSSF
jgi:protein transport protein SEC23